MLSLLTSPLLDCLHVGLSLLESFPTWPSGTARRWQNLRDGFDSRLEPIAFYICNGWLLTQRAQAHFAVYLNYR